MAIDVTDLKKEDVREIPTTWVPLLKRVMHVITRAHVWLFDASQGRLGKTFAGAPCCMVKMKGRKSGRVVSIPLIHIPDGDDVILIASQGGLEKNPAWYYNMMADPNVVVVADGTTRNMVARKADDAEKAERWPRAVAVYPDFNEYQARTERDIPLFICSPA